MSCLSSVKQIWKFHLIIISVSTINSNEVDLLIFPQVLLILLSWYELKDSHVKSFLIEVWRNTHSEKQCAHIRFSLKPENTIRFCISNLLWIKQYIPYRNYFKLSFNPAATSVKVACSTHRCSAEVWKPCSKLNSPETSLDCLLQ